MAKKKRNQGSADFSWGEFGLHQFSVLQFLHVEFERVPRQCMQFSCVEFHSSDPTTAWVATIVLSTVEIDGSGRNAT